MYSPHSLPHSFFQPRPSSHGNCKPKSPQNASYCGSVIPLDVTLPLHRCKNLRTALSSPSRISAAPTAATAASSFSSRRSSCLCSPSTHEGAFKCSLHRRKCRDNIGSEGAASVSSAQKLKRSVSNSPGGIRSEVARRALMRPHVDAGLQNPRRTKFERRPSRLSRVRMATP